MPCGTCCWREASRQAEPPEWRRRAEAACISASAAETPAAGAAGAGDLERLRERARAAVALPFSSPQAAAAPRGAEFLSYVTAKPLCLALTAAAAAAGLPILTNAMPLQESGHEGARV